MNDVKKRALFLLLLLCMAAGMLPAITQTAQAAETMDQLRKEFQDGKYWNHYVDSAWNNGDNLLRRNDKTFANDVSNVPCAHHGDGYSGNYVGLYDCNNFDGLQCFGFARMLACRYYGLNSTNNGGWYDSTNNGLSSLKAGDIIDYGWTSAPGMERNHSIWITSVTGDTFTYADCNGQSLASPLYNCQIRWNVSGSKSMITKNYRIWHAPYPAEDTPAPPPIDRGDGFYAGIYYVAGGAFIEATGGDGSTYTDVRLGPQNLSVNLKDPKQIWYFKRHDDGSYKIINEYCGWCLDVAGGVAYGECNVATWHEDHEKNPERWFLLPADDDRWYNLTTALDYPKYNLDIYKGWSDAGTNVQIWDRDGANTAQQFNIVITDYQKPTQPSAPTNIKVNAATDGTTITWDPVPLADFYDSRGYRVRLLENGSNSVLFDHIVYTASYTSSMVLPAGDYTAYVNAVNTAYSANSSNYSSGAAEYGFSVRPSVTISLSASPEEGGTVFGGGICQQGKTVNMFAVPNNGYHFVKWVYDDGEIFSEDDTILSLVVNYDGHFTAIFEKDAPQTGTILGDLTGDGKTNIGDVVKLARAVAGYINLTDREREMADVTGDGKVNIGDVVKLARYVAGYIPSLNIG